MKKVKIFARRSFDALETEINEFISSPRVQEILDIKYSTSTVALSDGSLDLYSALIYYEAADHSADLEDYEF